MIRRWMLVVLACGLWLSMWFWVQRIAIPHQQAESAALGVPRGNLSDLYPRWLGARELLLHGRDPYSFEVTREIQAGYYGRPIDAARPNDPRDQQAFAYPAYVVFLLAPSVGLPFAFVQRFFFWLLIAVTAASVLVWMQALDWRTSLTEKLVWVALVLGSYPAIQGFKLQQLSLLVAALIAAAMLAVARRHFAWAGMFLALASIKPQLAVLPAAWLLIWATGNWRERKRLFWSFSAAMMLLIAGAEVILPGWIGKFLAASRAYYQYTGGGRSVLDVTLTPFVGRVLAAVIVLAMAIVVWRSRRDAEGSAAFQWSLAIVMATTLVVVPMFAPYNQLLLIPAIMVLVRQRSSVWMGGKLARFLLVAAAFSVLWPWLATTCLSIASLILPTSTVQKAWTLPLYTSLAIPVMIWAASIVGARQLADRR